MTANTEQSEKRFNKIANKNYSGAGAMFCPYILVDTTGEFKSMPFEADEEAYCDLVLEALNRAPAEPTAEHGELVKDIHAEIKSLVTASMGESNPREQKYISKHLYLLRRCLSALSTEPDTVSISREYAEDAVALFRASGGVFTNGAKRIKQALEGET